VLSAPSAAVAVDGPIPEECVTDVQGADDEPGQKDLSKFCEVPGTGGVFELQASWNFDDLRWSGGNTGDSCGLFDTDGNGFADVALCVTVESGPPASMQAGSPRLFTCGNDRPDRCTNGVEVTDGFDSTCTVNSPGEDEDPFKSDPLHSGSNACNGTDCIDEDTYIVCWIEVDDLPVTPSCVSNACTNDPQQFCSMDGDCLPLTDVCSYPSMQPNSDPSDCIITPTAQDPCRDVDCSSLDDACNTGTCNSATGQCEQDAKAQGTPCGNVDDTACDDPDTCDGSGACQENHESTDVICRQDAGDCDVAEQCDGEGTCPADSYEPTGTSCGDTSDSVCDNPDSCDAYGGCQDNHELTEVVCREDSGECDVAELCDGEGACPADAYEPSGTSCGDSSDSVCDNPNSCDGSGACQDNHESTDVICREDAGECDVAELCDGEGACPADAYEPSGTSCGDSSDSVCDNPNSCDGSGACQDNHESSETVCREDAGDCDVTELCDGQGACPADSFEPAGTSCGDSADSVCDNPDSCNESGVCQDNHESTDVVCREDAGDCDVAELCDGEGACPVDAYEPSGTSCGDSSDSVCDNPDICDGSGACQDNHESSETVCREDAGDCDVAELCDGQGACPADGFEPAGTSCGESADSVCDNPDTCDASGSCEANYESTLSVCREDAGDCDVAERCDGEGGCPVDALEEDGSSCDDGEICTGPDRCVAGECHGEPIRPTLTVIKEVINDHEGPCEANDFQLVLNYGQGDIPFRVDLDPDYPTIGTAIFELDHGMTYQVTELLGSLTGYYQASYIGDCTGTVSCAEPDSVCTITNDDIYHKNQTSIAFEWLTVGFPEGDGSRTTLEGSFEITDQSQPGDQPDGLLVVLDDYAADFEYRISGDSSFQPTDWNGPEGGALLIESVEYSYTCEYDMVDIDGVSGNPDGYQSSDPVIFDESIVIHYSCTFDRALPEDGLVRAIATGGVFTKSGQVFHTRQGFDLESGTMSSGQTSEPSTSTTTTTVVSPDGDPGTETITTTTTLPSDDGELPYPGTCWDPNADGLTSVRDALHMLRAAISLLHDGQVCPIQVCDQNCDGKITVRDVLIALRRSVGSLDCVFNGNCQDAPSCCG
jgi:hypothetical protein